MSQSERGDQGDLVVTHDLVRLAPGDRASAASTSFVWKGQDCRTLGRSAARAGEGWQRKHDVLIAVITAPPACRRGTTIRADTARGTESEE
jgi:hypothetical protein